MMTTSLAKSATVLRRSADETIAAPFRHSHLNIRTLAVQIAGAVQQKLAIERCLTY
jgi:hypothetical protein